MSYLPYVIAAYAVFALVLLWDFFVPRLQVRRLLRDARLRGSRRRPAPAPAADTELVR
nr:J45 [uncultured bacterium]